MYKLFEDNIETSKNTNYILFILIFIITILGTITGNILFQFTNILF